MVKITISFGYDTHSINISEAQYERIKAGKRVRIRGQGFMHEEEGHVLDHWAFNETPGSIRFWLDNAVEFHAQEFWIEGS